MSWQRARAFDPKPLVLVGGLVLAAVAACGPGEGGSGPAPQVPAPVAPGSSAPPTETAPAPSSGATAGVAPPSSAPANAPMKPIVASSMETKLREIGLDPAALPPLNKLDPKTLRDVMNTFTKALGVQCSHCHEKNFRAPTQKKKIATHMWNDLTRELAIDGGGALYCDSCHGGHDDFLDRHDLAALGTWMQDNYVDKLKRADSREHSCDTCHGDPFEGKILTKLWK